MTNFEKVKIFMKTFGQEVKEKSSFSSDKINKLRINLIKEELEELKIAIDTKNLIEVADALTDILYVTYAAGHEGQKKSVLMLSGDQKYQRSHTWFRLPKDLKKSHGLRNS